MNKFTNQGVIDIVRWMKSNSLAWLKADEVTRKVLAQQNQAAGIVLNGVYGVGTTYCPQDGEWYIGGYIGSDKLYDAVN